VITNDPWIGSGHLQDISMVAPVFNRNGKLVAFSGGRASAGHGGRWTAENREIYEEGLQIPICKLAKRGEPNRDVFNIIRRNVRVPDQVIGDIYAMIASCTVAANRSTHSWRKSASILNEPPPQSTISPKAQCATKSRRSPTAAITTSMKSTATTSR
jgi:N-methylhydantoinase B